ncbi:MAG: hypothetical protein R3B89_00285 [Polyangiaceae bacterium]
MEYLPDVDGIKAVVRRFGGLLAELAEELGERPLVLPNAKYFPDEFAPNARGARRLLRRMQRHAGLDDVPVELELIGESEESGGSCGSGGCGSGSCSTTDSAGELQRLVPRGDGWLLRVLAAELKYPVQLTTNLAIALGHVFLFETAEEGTSPAELEVNAEFAAVGLGFGVLLLEGSHIYSKSCGGPQVVKLTRLSLGELAIATALFASWQQKSLRGALRELSTTQTAVLKEADALLASNPRIAELLRSAPDALANGNFELEDSKPWLMRLFNRKADDQVPETLEEMEAYAARMGAAKAKQSSRRRDPKRDELRALVEEALAEEG